MPILNYRRIRWCNGKDSLVLFWRKVKGGNRNNHEKSPGLFLQKQINS